MDNNTPSTNPEEEHRVPEVNPYIPPVASYPIPGTEHRGVEERFASQGALVDDPEAGPASDPLGGSVGDPLRELEGESNRVYTREEQVEPAGIPGEGPAETISPDATYSAPEPPPPGFGEWAVPGAGPSTEAAVPTRTVPAPRYRPGAAAQQQKNRGVALLLEILPSLVGFLGLGWIYAGNTTVGVIVLISFLAWNIFAFFLSLITLLLFACLWIPINLTVVALSAILLNNYTRQRPEIFGR